MPRPAQVRAAAIPPGVPGRRAADRARGRAGLRHRAQPLLALRLGRPGREVLARRPAGRVVPHAGQGQELLPGSGRAAGVATSVSTPSRPSSTRPTGSWLPPRPRPRSSSACTGPSPHCVRLVPPGVDHRLFLPGDRAAARERLHLSGLRLALYVGRLQPHKGPDIAVRTLAEAVARDPEVAGDLVLAIVGGPSGPDKDVEVARLLELASALGVSERVMLFPPQPQTKLVGLLHGGRRRARALEFRVVRIGRPRGPGMRHAGGGGRRRRAALRRRGRPERLPRRGSRPR